MNITLLISICCLLSLSTFSQFGEIKNIDGKYGIFDHSHGMVVSTSYDKIISKKDWNGRFFILQKDNKYAYAYFRNLDSLGNFGYLYPKWIVSDFIYDTLLPTDRTLLFNYKKNGKYGLIRFPTIFDCNDGIFTICILEGIGEIYETQAIFDDLIEYSDDFVLEVKLNGKYGFLELLNHKDEWINYMYNELFDSKTLRIISFDYSGPQSKYIELFRTVRKNNKWGIVKIDTSMKELDYVVPCICDSIERGCYDNPDKENPRGDGEVYLCSQLDNQKSILYWEKDSLTINFINQPPINYFKSIYEIDTIPDEFTRESHKRYAYFELGKFDKQSKIMRNTGYCIVDLQNRKPTFYIDDEFTKYKIIFGYHGIIIEKQIIEKNSIIYQYFDFETKAIKLNLKSSNENLIYRVNNYDFRTYYTKDYFKIELVKEKKGNNKYKDIYYYDFRLKKFIRGKCNKGC
jgi:hypothetical protein